MVRIRLKRTGTRNAICFRVVVMDQRSSRDGKAIEQLGFYNPRSKEEKIDLERAEYWKSVGAVVSETVEDIIDRVRSGKSLKDRVRKPALSKKAKAKAAAEAEAKAKAEEEAKAAAEAAAAEETAGAEAAPEA
ncbi:MAG: 30S ribosomal protein S16 [Lentisphaeria bacterium]|nr:30S ribosomal protein S16 [Lentisphaeria bacterium]